MYNEINSLLLFSPEKGSVLDEMGEIFLLEGQTQTTHSQLRKMIYTLIKRILQLSTDFGFDKNLWRDYLTFYIVTNENPFSLTCEKMGKRYGSVNDFAMADFHIFRELFHYDFSPLESRLEIDCFSVITNYTAIKKDRRMYNQSVSEKIRALSDKLSEADSDREFFNIVTGFYADYGVGMFGLNRAFKVEQGETLEIVPINNMSEVMLSDLVGYELQKSKLIENTRAFVEGRSANNVLLFGDSGTGKSTSIKAIVNQFYAKGLRMIEIYKHQFKDLSNVISAVKDRNYKFIIYMDDLSFEEFEIEYKYLKAVIEGGAQARPENVLLYATSNRRHLIKETWTDRNDITQDELHHSDTMEEKLSLVHRFGLTINFSKPSKAEYYNIVNELAKRYENINMSEDELKLAANRWEMMHGGISGRTAQQFIDYLAGKE